jgi:hypothetical protein
MKRLMTVVSLVALSATAASAASTPEPHASAAAAKAKPIVPHVVFLKYKVAPADEYFGRLKLSILGIRNTIRDLGYKADADPPHAASILGSLALTEDAMHDWESKYPKDSWIPPAILALERTLAKVDSDEARAKAKFVMVWLVHDYPKTAPGKVGQHELAANMVGVKPSPPADTAVAGGASQDGQTASTR